MKRWSFMRGSATRYGLRGSVAGRRRAALASTPARWRRCCRFPCRRATGEPAAGAPKLDPFVGVIEGILKEDEDGR